MGARAAEDRRRRVVVGKDVSAPESDKPALPVLPVLPVPSDVAAEGFLRNVCLDMFVLTSSLAVPAADAAAVAKTVLDMCERAKVTGAAGAMVDELETELCGGKAPRKTRRNTQSVLRLSGEAVVAMRHVDYTTETNIRHSNFRNSFTARKVDPAWSETGPRGIATLKGPTVKFFKNGRLQGAGWKTVAEFETFVDEVARLLGLPGIDRSANKLSLVNGSARIRDVPAGGIMLADLAARLRASGHTVRWDPTTGNNGLNLKLPDVESERSAMVFSNGYVKVFALNEAQLGRLFATLSRILCDAF